MPDTPWLFRIQLEHTPSLNDPKGSRDFYEALGLLVWHGAGSKGIFSHLS
jgi:hypothetical protein